LATSKNQTVVEVSDAGQSPFLSGSAGVGEKGIATPPDRPGRGGRRDGGRGCKWTERTSEFGLANRERLRNRADRRVRVGL